MSEEVNVATHVPTSEAEADALIAHVEAPAEQQQEQVQATAEQQPAQQPVEEKPLSPTEFELSRKGVNKKFPLQKILEFAQQGWDYNEKMSGLKSKEQEILAKSQEYQQLSDKIKQYSEVEEYIKKDPDWWTHVREQYQQRITEQSGNPASPVYREIDELKTTVKSLAEYINEQKQLQEVSRKAEEDKAFGQDVEKYISSNPDFDWNSTDQNGTNLEQRILAHAIENKIGSFRAAANDYLADERARRIELKTKEKMADELKRTSKQGLGPVTNHPTQGIKRAKNVAASSYEDLYREALAEVGI